MASLLSSLDAFAPQMLARVLTYLGELVLGRGIGPDPSYALLKAVAKEICRAYLLAAHHNEGFAEREAENNWNFWRNEARAALRAIANMEV